MVVAFRLGALLPAGTGAAREWEKETMKGLLLSPASRWAMLAGKMLGAFLMSLASVSLVLVVLIVVVGIWPVHWGEMIAFSLLTLAIFIALGTLLGTLLKQRQPVVSLAFGASIPLFFLSGAFGPISFTTPAVPVLAQLFPAFSVILFQPRALPTFQPHPLG